MAGGQTLQTSSDALNEYLQLPSFGTMGHATHGYKDNPTMNLITQYGLLWISVGQADFIISVDVRVGVRFGGGLGLGSV